MSNCSATTQSHTEKNPSNGSNNPNDNQMLLIKAKVDNFLTL